MNPIGQVGVIAFLDWIRRWHPEVRSLRSLSKGEFLRLATSYEGSKGVPIGPSHQLYRKWETTHWVFKDSESDDEALTRLRW